MYTSYTLLSYKFLFANFQLKWWIIFIFQAKNLWKSYKDYRRCEWENPLLLTHCGLPPEMITHFFPSYIHVRWKERVLPFGKTSLLLETTAVHGGVDMGRASTDKEQKLINWLPPMFFVKLRTFANRRGKYKEPSTFQPEAYIDTLRIGMCVVTP